MLTLYRNNQPFVIILIIFTVFVLWIPFFIDPEYYLGGYNFQEQPLDLLSIISSWNQYFWLFLSLFLCLFLAFRVSFINLNQQLIEKRNYLPALFFLLSLSWIPDLKININSLIALIFISFALNSILSFYNKKNGLSVYFISGILIALASLLYFHFSVFLIVLWIAIFLFQRSSWRNFLTAVIGFLIPWGFYYGIYYFINGSVSKLNQLIYNIFVSNKSFEEINILLWVLIGLTILTILLSSIHFVRKRGQAKVREKRFFYLFLWTFIIVMIQYFVLPVHESLILLGMVIPLSFLFSRYFSLIKSDWKGNLIFNVYFFSIMIAQYLFVFIEI